MKKVMKWILGILLGLSLIGIFVPNPSKKEKSTPAPDMALTEIPKEPGKPVEVPKPEPTSAERLAKAKEYLAGGNESWAGEEALLSIKQGEKEYPEAQRILKQIHANKQIQSQKMKAKLQKEEAEAEKLSITVRKEYAKKLEYELLNKSKMDTTITTSGKNNTTIKIKYILVSRVFANELTKNTELISTLRSMGFKKIILTDGYRGGWIVDL